MRFISDAISVSRDSYELSFNLVYHSRMSSVISNKCLGLPERFKTNYHQFLIEDGEDENEHPIYKYIDGFGYIHTFYYVNSLLYYCNESELYLCFETETGFLSEIVNSKKDKMYFDNLGRLVRIVNGFDDTNIKTITYDENGYITKIRDERDTRAYIRFFYTNSKLSFVNFYYNLSISKRICLTYSSNFLVEMNEDDNSTETRNLYTFHYNSDTSIPASSFDRIDFIENHLTHLVYKIQYNYISLYADYLVSYIQKGYFQDANTFVVKETIQRIGYSLRTDDWKTTNEVSITKNGISFSYSMDKNAHITAVFNGLTCDNFATLYKETGVYLPISGNTQPIYVNYHRFIKLTSFLPISFPSDAITLLNDYRYFVLRLYLKLNDYTSKRVRASVTASGIISYPIDININQYDKYQLVEIPITRTSNNITSLTISLSFKNENNSFVNVDIGNIYFDKKANTTLWFKNGNVCHRFNEVTSVGVYANYYDQTPTRIINITGELKMSEGDFLNSVLHLHNCFNLLFGDCYSPSAHPLYFNDGKVVDTYNFRFVLFVNNTPIFDSYSPGNIDLDSSSGNTWFFETIFPDMTILSSTNDSSKRAYYSFPSSDANLLITNRNGTINGNSFIKMNEEIVAYDFFGKMISSTKNKFIPVVLSNITEYEYFTNGEISKVTSTDGNENIVLYEANENNKGFISRKTSGKNSVDIAYYRDRVSSIIRNTVSGSTVINGPYSKSYSYNAFDNEPVTTKFKLNNEIKCTNTNRVDYSLGTDYFSNGGTGYVVFYHVSSNDLTYTVLDGGGQTILLFTLSEDANGSTTFYAPPNATIINEKNSYGKLTHINVNSVDKVDYSYTNSGESYSASNLTSVTDKFNSANGLVTAFTYDQFDNSLAETNYNNDEFIIDESYYTNGIIYDFGMFGMSYIYSVNETEIRLEDHIYHDIRINTFSIQKDSFDRIVKHCSVVADISTYCLIDDVSYNPNSLLVNNYAFGINTNGGTTIAYQLYQESYSYDIYGNLSDVYTNGESFPRFSYNYDGFGRIIEEYNVSIAEYNRSYAYDSFGRLSSVDNDSLIYDVKGRLTSFGSITFTYDAYGNRLTKGNESYQWTRGTLLSQFTKGSQTVQFSYDYQGRRFQKKINNSLIITYYYHGNRLIGEKRSDNKEIRYFYDETGIVGFAYYDGYSNNTYRYAKNPFNQIIGIYSDSGERIATYIYDAWGNHKVLDANGDIDIDMSSVGNVNPIRYKGYYYDVETGLYYLLTRYYDPSIMQFISPDEFQYLNQDNISGYHLYAYCNNNPVMLMDEDGHLAISLAMLGLIAGALIGATIGGVITYNKMKNEGKEGWELFGLTALGALGGAVVGGIIGYVAGSVITEFTGIVGLSITKDYVLPIKAITVLGSNPAYVNVAKYIGASAFNIPKEVYLSLNPCEQWRLNVTFLNDAITLGSEFAVTGIRAARPSSALWDEIEFLIEHGIEWRMF